MLLPPWRIAALLIVAVGLLPYAGAQSSSAPCTIERIAGSTDSSRFEGVDALQAELLSPIDFDRGPDGLLYILDSAAETILRVNAQGSLEVFAGTGDRGSGGDGGPARQASFLESRQIRFGPDGSLYVLDGPFLERRVRRIAPDGTIDLFIQLGEAGKYGLGDTAEEMGLLGITSFDVGTDGSLYLTSDALHRIFRVAPDGTSSIVAGAGDPVQDTGAYSGDGGPAVDAELDRPDRIAVAPDGTIYFTDGRSSTERIRRILPDGTIETYMVRSNGAGIGALRSETGYSRPLGDLGLDEQGRLYWMDSDLNGRAIKRIGLDDRVELVWEAGDVSIFGRPLPVNGEVYLLSLPQLLRAGAEPGMPEAAAGVARHLAGYGDGGPPLAASFVAPSAIAVGLQGEVFLVDIPTVRVRVMRNGLIEGFAGSGLVRPLSSSLIDQAGDGGPALQAAFRDLSSLATGPEGSLYVADGGFVRRIRPDGIIKRYAGDGMACPSAGLGINCGDGGPAAQAQLGQSVRQITVDRFGVGSILAFENRGRGVWVRRVGADGTITTLDPQFAPGVHASDASAIALRNREDLLVSTPREGLWSIDPQGTATQLEPASDNYQGVASMAAGNSGSLFFVNGSRGLFQRRADGSLDLLLPFRRSDEDSGDGGAPRDASSGASIGSLATDTVGNLYLSDTTNSVIRRINAPDACPQVNRPQISSVTDASFFPVSLSPGAIMTLFGSGLGPAQGAVAAPNLDGRFPVELAGVRVLVDGVEAPVLYVSESQINAIVPLGAKVLAARVERAGFPGAAERVATSSAAGSDSTRAAASADGGRKLRA